MKSNRAYKKDKNQKSELGIAIKDKSLNLNGCEKLFFVDASYFRVLCNGRIKTESI